MERDFAGAQLVPTDFERLRARCMSDPKFPKTYQAWLDLVADGTRQRLVAAEGEVEALQIDVDDYLKWSERVGVVSGMDGLRAYLLIHRRQRQDAAASHSSHGGPSPDVPTRRSPSLRVSLLERSLALLERLGPVRTLAA